MRSRLVREGEATWPPLAICIRSAAVAHAGGVDYLMEGAKSTNNPELAALVGDLMRCPRWASPDDGVEVSTARARGFPVRVVVAWASWPIP